MRHIVVDFAVAISSVFHQHLSLFLCISSFCCVGLLIEQLTRGTYECMICCNAVKLEAAVWNCSNCYHIYHLYCIKRWANSSMVNTEGGGNGNGWRCPACQNATAVFPNTYMCFCGMFLLSTLYFYCAAFHKFFDNLCTICGNSEVNWAI